MTPRTMLDAAEIYAVASTAHVVWDSIEDPLFEEFSLGVNALERVLAEDKDDDFWIEVRRILRRARSAVSATPLPFCHLSLGLKRSCHDIAPLVARADAQYTDEPVRMLEQVVALLESLAVSPNNPLGERVVALGSGAREIGLLLPIARYKESVLRFIRSIGSLSGVNVLTPQELADCRRPYAGLLVTGSLQWYRHDRHVVVSPRAHVVHMLRWEWIRDSLPDTTFFAASRLGQCVQADSPPAPCTRSATLDAADLAPQIDWAALSNKFADEKGSASGESVEAIVLLLAGHRAVAVSGARGTIHIVEPELNGPKRIRESEVNDLEVGDFVLLRSQGGGDLVVEVANQELGKSATSLRALQNEWKAALRARVAASTYSSVVSQLHRLGAVRASPQNLRNWMSPRSLKTANIEDFVGIMKLIGREGEINRFWDAMNLLDNAHRRAGHSIRRMLISVVADADLRLLDTEGVMEFELKAKDGGRLTAIRVEAIAPDPIQVGENRIGRLVSAGDLWLE